MASWQDGSVAAGLPGWTAAWQSANHHTHKHTHIPVRRIQLKFHAFDVDVYLEDTRY